MSKFNCMHMLACAWTGFLKWLMDARMIIILCICIFVYSFVVDPIMANAKLMNESINVLEPFIATLNSGMVLLIIPLGFLTLISDYPKIDDSSIFYIFRIGKKNWLFGQILQLLLMVVTYLLAIFTASVAGACMSGYIGKEWSRVTTNFVAEFPEQSGNFGALLLPENLYNQMTLPVALIESTLFVIMYLFFLGMLLRCGKKGGRIDHLWTDHCSGFCLLFDQYKINVDFSDAARDCMAALYQVFARTGCPDRLFGDLFHLRYSGRVGFLYSFLETI